MSWDDRRATGGGIEAKAAGTSVSAAFIVVWWIQVHRRTFAALGGCVS
jgi:hypothetical protein